MILLGRNVVLIRPIFIEVCPQDEALKLRWIGPPFFFSLELSYKERAPEPRLDGLTGFAGQFSQKTSCSARLHCAEWSCVVLGDSPRHHSGSGRNWPYKSLARRSGCVVAHIRPGTPAPAPGWDPFEKTGLADRIDPAPFEARARMVGRLR